jgi:hypothetical protein
LVLKTKVILLNHHLTFVEQLFGSLEEGMEQKAVRMALRRYTHLTSGSGASPGWGSRWWAGAGTTLNPES